MIRISGETLLVIIALFSFLLFFITPLYINNWEFQEDPPFYLGFMYTVGLISGIGAFISIVISIYNYILDLNEITIKLPHFYIQEYFREKKEVQEKRNKLYTALFNAKTGEEIDLINKKLEALANSK